MPRSTRHALRSALAAVALAAGPACGADALTVPMAKATSGGPGDSVGSVTIAESAGGLTFTLALSHLPPGPHGFHLHQNGSCMPTMTASVRIAAGAAGGHWDPDNTGKHLGPDGAGDRGDLPLIEVGHDGTATQTLTAPRLKNLDDLRGRSLVIKVRGDNYSDQPDSQGGGGPRLACGAIPK